MEEEKRGGEKRKGRVVESLLKFVNTVRLIFGARKPSMGTGGKKGG